MPGRYACPVLENKQQTGEKQQQADSTGTLVRLRENVVVLLHY
ncbi:MAG: hypothetical protein NUV63_06265 [Gallionella sp.]|nr:hypothetical protein [Gallionella sp.]